METALKLSKELPIISEIANLQAEIDALKLISDERIGRIMQKLRLDWNYHSNAIEGNKLDYGETLAFLMHGLTAKGKPLKDHLDIKGHNEAIGFLTSLVKDERGISEQDIRALHKMILVEPYEVDTINPSGLPSKKKIKLGEYKTSPNHVKTQTGEIHYYASSEETPSMMSDLMRWLEEILANQEVSPLVTAAIFHHKFVSIHPFDDGNGRMVRLIMNFILMRADFPPVVIKQDNCEAYYAALSQADAGNPIPFVEYVGEALKYALEIYLKGARGEDISEPDDIDKQIALLKQSLSEDEKNAVPKSKETVRQVIKNIAIPFFQKLEQKCNQLNDLFFDVAKSFAFEIKDGDTFYTTGIDGTENKEYSINWNKIESSWIYNEFDLFFDKYDSKPSSKTNFAYIHFNTLLFQYLF